MSDSDLVEDVVDADARLVYEDGREERIEFVDIMDYVNQPLDRDTVESYLEAKRKESNSMRPATTEIDVESDLAEMGREYYRHIDSFDVEVDLHYDTNGDDEAEKTRTLVGDPRTDLDMRNGVFPSILPMQFEDSEQQLVLREMQTYDRDFVKYIAREADFTGKNGSAFDWSVEDTIGTEDYDPEVDPDTFAYVPEPLDFLGINGVDGYHERVQEEEALPYISVPDWAVLDIDESSESIVGVRPFYDAVWEAGVSTSEAEKVGRWRGANRGIGRTIHDMDDEFFHGFNGNDHFIGFYDNEFPHIVGSELAFDGDEWQRFKKKFGKQVEAGEEWQEHLFDEIRDKERETAEIVDEIDLDYSELIDGKLDRSRIPDDMRAHKIF